MSKKKKDSGVGCLLLIFGWLVFILLALIFYFYFMDKLDFFNKNEATTTEAVQGPLDETTEQYETKFSYKTNANLDINSLIIEYYAALAVCDQEKLKSLVTDGTVFDDMTPYEQKSQVITHYSNINCYTMPGYTDDAILLYVTCNINISGVSSAPMDISQYYITKTAEGYKINNSALDEATTAYIQQQNQTADIQELYQNVKINIDNCISTDPSFAEFYNKINGVQ